MRGFASKSTLLCTYASFSKGLCWHFNDNFLHNNRDQNPRTQMNLLKPSSRAERAIDTLHHYQTSSDQTPGPIPTTVTRRVADYLPDYFFPTLDEFRSHGSQLCGRAHMH